MLVLWLSATACSGGGGAPGEACDTHGDCADRLQCFAGACVPRCERAPDCGDGHTCAASGVCVRGAAGAGDACASEAACAPGLSCRLDDDDPDGDGRLAATCAADQDGAAVGAPCATDDACRGGTCALGRCVDVCANVFDCPTGDACTTIPRTSVAGAPTFLGCLPEAGTLTFDVPVAGPADTVSVPVPVGAEGLALTFSLDVPSQQVGATRLVRPSGGVLYELPLSEAEFYANPVRHAPALGHSVLMLPGSPELPLETGAYAVGVSSFLQVGQPGTATPRVQASVKLGRGVALDLHFWFLDLGDHPCRDAFGAERLDAEAAALEPFQRYLAELRGILGLAGVPLRGLTFTDLPGLPDLDYLRTDRLPALLASAPDRGGINVFFVRGLVPAGLHALVGGTPGVPAGGATPPGGVVIAADALCTRSWERVARTTAHALARHLGLFRNVDPRGQPDPISDSDDSVDNLMAASEAGGVHLSVGQRQVLRSSVVLR